MRKDPKEFRERFQRWKAGEQVYKDGLPAYEEGKEEEVGLGKIPGVGIIRKRLYNNVMPMGYDDPFSRVFNGVILNKQEGQRDFKQPSNAYKVLDSLWGEYLKIPKKDRQFKDWKYGITKYNEDGKTFYKLNDPSLLYGDIKEANIPLILKTKKHRDDNYYHTLYYNTDIEPYRNTNARQNFILGDFQIQRKHDNNIGDYIEYTDTWDVNPYQKTYNLYGQVHPEDMSIGDKILSKILPAGGDASLGIGKPLPIKGKISMEQFYGVPYKSTAADKTKSEYYGGWLPEIMITGINKHTQNELRNK